MEHFLMVAGMAGVTFMIRYSLLPLSGRIHFSEALQRALGYVPVAVLTAIIVPAAVMPDGHNLQISWSNPYLVGAILTTVIGLVSSVFVKASKESVLRDPSGITFAIPIRYARELLSGVPPREAQEPE